MNPPMKQKETHKSRNWWMPGEFGCRHWQTGVEVER